MVCAWTSIFPVIARSEATWQSVCLLAVNFYEEVPARGTDCHGFFEASQ